MSHDFASDSSNEYTFLTAEEGYAMGRHHGIARFHIDFLSRQGLKNEDIVALRGGRRTFARVHQLYPTDEAQDIVRMDEILRSNAGVGKGGKLGVKPWRNEVPAAEALVVSPVAEAFSFMSESHLAQQLESVPVTAGDFVVFRHFREKLVLRVMKVRISGTDLSRRAEDANIVAEITKESKIIFQPKPIIKHQQSLIYAAGLGRANKGPIDLSIVAQGIADESITQEGLRELGSLDDGGDSRNSVKDPGIILSLELTLSSARFIRETRTFRRLVPPNEHAARMIQMALDNAMRIVNQANAQLTPATGELTPTDPPHEMFSQNKENRDKMNLLLQTVFKTADKIVSDWSTIAPDKMENDESQEGAIGGGDTFIG